MKAFFKKYMGFIGNLLALGAMLGACFGAVVYIQDAPNRAITALAISAAESDKALEQKIVSEAAALRAERAIFKEARDREMAQLRVEVKTYFDSLKDSLDRIEQRQYDQRKRAEKFPTAFDGG